MPRGRLTPASGSTAIRMGKQIKHRGPDWSGNHTANSTVRTAKYAAPYEVFCEGRRLTLLVGKILVHERLSIVGIDTGSQPILNEEGDIALAVNGEV